MPPNYPFIGTEEPLLSMAAPSIYVGDKSG